MPPKEPTFILLQRSARGGLTRDARHEANDLTSGAFEFKTGKNPDTKVLQELQQILPKNVRLAKASPFTVLKVTPRPPDQPQGCLCKCGTSMNCGGGGGGSGVI